MACWLSGQPVKANGERKRHLNSRFVIPVHEEVVSFKEGRVHADPIRLTYERWYHIVENHDEMASCYHDVLEAIEAPDLVVRGNGGALKAGRSLGKRKWLIGLTIMNASTVGRTKTGGARDKAK